MIKPEIIRFKPEYERQLLLLGVKQKFLKNRIIYAQGVGEDISAINSASNFEHFIKDAFIWSDTPEKHDFWNRISLGIKPEQL
jgi:hypothetical protein